MTDYSTKRYNERCYPYIAYRGGIYLSEDYSNKTKDIPCCGKGCIGCKRRA